MPKLGGYQYYLNCYKKGWKISYALSTQRMLKKQKGNRNHSQKMHFVVSAVQHYDRN